VFRRRLIHVLFVVAFALANVLQAAANDRAGHARAGAATPTIAVAAAPIAHVVPPRLKGGDQAWALGYSLVDPALSIARLTPTRTGHAQGARASCLEFLRRAPAGSRPPPQR
jgi:hypothetical protein